MSVNAESALE